MLLLASAPSDAQTIEITSLPAYGELGSLTGQVSGVNPATHHVATYIQIEGLGWWTKPTLASPTVPIAGNGSFSADVGTGGPASLDGHATIFCVALLPTSTFPPTVSQSGRIPASLAPLAVDCEERYGRTLTFAGLTLAVKTSPSPAGPGNNRFSDRVADVFVDGDGLHLRIDFHDGAWWSSEVIVLESLGYGTVAVQTDSRNDVLDPSVTFGLFSWDPHGDDDAVPGGPNREIDFEDSRWGVPGAANAQWVVQPYAVAGNLGSYTIPDLSADAALTRIFSWAPGGIQFTALRGHHPPCCFPLSALIAHALYLEDPEVDHLVPTAGRERLRLNLWINGGGQPSDGQPAEVVISDIVLMPEPLGGEMLIAGAAAVFALARLRRASCS